MGKGKKVISMAKAAEAAAPVLKQALADVVHAHDREGIAIADFWNAYHERFSTANCWTTSTVFLKQEPGQEFAGGAENTHHGTALQTAEKRDIRSKRDARG